MDISSFDPTMISTIVAGVFALILAIGNVIQEFQKKDKDKTIAAGETAIASGVSLVKNVIKLFSSDVPMDKEQEALITDGIVPAKTCFMSDANKESLWTNLRAHGGEFTRNDLNDLVSWAEGNKDVEYAIILVDKNGNPDKRVRVEGKPETEIYHAFVSYGVPTYAKYDEVHAQALATSSPEYNLNTKWIMLDAVKEQIISEIGTSYPKCISEFINKVAEAEDKQIEEYSVNCNNHTWVIKQGDIIAGYTCAKTET